jgi:hypothetical protein
MTTTTQIHLDHLTLDSVKQAFDHWRNNRGHTKKTPLSLCQQVAQLIPHYRQRQILKTLGINHAQLGRYLDATTQRSTDAHPVEITPPPQPPSSFVKAFLPPAADQTYQVEWQRPDGALLTIKNLDSTGLSMLIQHWRI